MPPDSPSPTPPPIHLRQIRERLKRHAPRTLAESGELAHAAVAMILRQSHPEAETELLIIWRAEHPQDPWSGHLGFPGGRIEPHDPSPSHAAARETREELGLDLDTYARPLGRLSEIRAVSLSRLMPLSIFPFVYELLEPASMQLNHEVVETRWIPLSFFLDPANRSTLTHPREPDRVRECYPLGDRALWGLSLRMLDELLFEALRPGV